MAEKWIQGILGYNYKNDRYGLLVTDLWEIDGFSCGNRLQVEIAGEWIDTHMEMDWSTGKGVWYPFLFVSVSIRHLNILPYGFRNEIHLFPTGRLSVNRIFYSCHCTLICPLCNS